MGRRGKQVEDIYGTVRIDVKLERGREGNKERGGLTSRGLREIKKGREKMNEWGGGGGREKEGGGGGGGTGNLLKTISGKIKKKGQLRLNSRTRREEVGKKKNRRLQNQTEKDSEDIPDVN